MAGMIRDGACNFVQAMPRYLYKIERLDKLASVQHKVGGGKKRIILRLCLSRLYWA